jgi:hypothetical protein
MKPEADVEVLCRQRRMNANELPPGVRDQVVARALRDSKVAAREQQLLEARLASAAYTPRGPDGSHSIAQRASARGFVRRELAIELGMWQLPTDSDAEALLRPRRRRSITAAAQRRAIERRAVEVATDKLESEGWAVEDVGAIESYDLDCVRGGEHLLVEVKGTTGPPDRVIVTANEVSLARAHAPATALLVVHHILFDDELGGRVRRISSLTEDDAPPGRQPFEVTRAGCCLRAERASTRWLPLCRTPTPTSSLPALQTPDEAPANS